MPYAELLKPRTLKLASGQIFTRGKKYPVTPAMAAILAENPRFKVTGLDVDTSDEPDVLDVPEAADVVTTRPERPKADIYAAIRTAADEIGADDDEAYDENGMPKAEVISAKLGVEVTTDDIVAALTSKPTEKAPATDAPKASRMTKPAGGAKKTEPAEAKPEGTPRKGLKIKHVGKADDAPKGDDTTKGGETSEETVEV